MKRLLGKWALLTAVSFSAAPLATACAFVGPEFAGVGFVPWRFVEVDDDDDDDLEDFFEDLFDDDDDDRRGFFGFRRDD